MTIDYHVIIGQKLIKQEQDKVSSIMLHTFHEVDILYNKWNPQSELSKLNSLKGGQKVDISPPLEHFLCLAGQLVDFTEGRFDPTIEPLQQLWKNKLTLGCTPLTEDIQQITPSIGWDKIHIEKGVFYKDHDLTQLDLGGIAKGYCVDLLVERLNAAGFPDVFVEWGGEIRATGKHPEKRPWNIFISRFGHPDPALAIAKLSLNDAAIATSGDYLQSWSIVENQDAATYYHIIDPSSKKMCQIRPGSISSASIMAENCAFADALATAVMLFSTTKEAEDWLNGLAREHPEIKFWLVSHGEAQLKR